MGNYNVYYKFASICKDLRIFPVRYLYFLRTMSPRPRGKEQPGPTLGNMVKADGWITDYGDNL